MLDRRRRRALARLGRSSGTYPRVRIRTGAWAISRLFARPDRGLFKLTERERELVFSLGLAAQPVENLAKFDPPLREQQIANLSLERRLCRLEHTDHFAQQ